MITWVVAVLVARTVSHSVLIRPGTSSHFRQSCTLQTYSIPLESLKGKAWYVALTLEPSAMRAALLARLDDFFDTGKEIESQADYKDVVDYDYNATYHVLRFAQEGRWTRAQTMVVGVKGEGTGEVGYRLAVELGCPSGCGGRGTCNSQGECECYPGFLGLACHFSSVVTQQLSSPLNLFLSRDTWTLIHLTQPYRSFTLLLEVRQESGRLTILMGELGKAGELPTFHNNQVRKEMAIGGGYEVKYTLQHENDSLVLSCYNGGNDTSLVMKAAQEPSQNSLTDLSVKVGLGGFLLVLVLGISSGCWRATFRRFHSATSQFSFGISQARIDALYPLRQYREVAPFGVADDCSICLERYSEEVSVRVLPCLHAYHGACIDGWFRSNQTCCLCKLNCVNLPEEEAETGVVSDTSQDSFHPRRTVEVD